MTVRAYNPTTTPIVVDRKGHTLAGGEWGDLDDSDSVAKAALERLVTEEQAGEYTPPDDDSGDSDQSEPPKTTTRSRRSGEKE